jgi:hypothetical protein
MIEEYSVKKMPCWLVITKYYVEVCETKEEAYRESQALNEGGTHKYNN